MQVEQCRIKHLFAALRGLRRARFAYAIAFMTFRNRRPNDTIMPAINFCHIDSGRAKYIRAVPTYYEKAADRYKVMSTFSRLRDRARTRLKIARGISVANDLRSR